MNKDDAPDSPSDDQADARLEALLSAAFPQTLEWNALRHERDHFKSAYGQAMAELADSRSQLEDSRAETARLEQVIRQLQRARFGRKSERVDPEQLNLALEGAKQDVAAASAAVEAVIGAADPAAAKPKRPPANRNRGHLPAHLERVERLIEPEDKTCPCCRGALHKVRDDITEQLDAVPMRLRVIATNRPVYGCRACALAMVQEPAPERPIAGGLPTTAFLAQLVVSKYADGLPLYRQAGIYARDGITLDRSTLCTWAGETAWWLKPLYDLMLTTALSSPKLFVDDTHLPVMAKGKTHKGALFGYVRDDSPWDGPLPPVAVWVYTDGRKHASPLPQLGTFSGVLQVDGWKGFKDLAASNPNGAIILAFCWSHARREFYEVFASTKSPIAAEINRRIAELYQIEDTIRGRPPDERKAVREVQSQPKIEALKTYIETQIAKVSGKSTLAKAMRYTLNHWKGLTVFLDDGRVEIDNNTIERLHRLVATIRKNSLFAGAETGARSWALFVSLIQTARLNGLDPFLYLRDVLERIVSAQTKANQLETLLPWNWKPLAAEPVAATAHRPSPRDYRRPKRMADQCARAESFTFGLRTLERGQVCQMHVLYQRA